MFKALQATSVGIPLGPFVTSTGVPNSGLTITAASLWVSKNNSIFALKSHSAACAADSLATGMYQCWLDGTDTATLGNMRVYCNYSGVLPVWEDGEVVASLGLYAVALANQVSLVSVAANVTTANTSLVSIATNISSIVATNATQTTSLVSIAANALSAVSSASLALTAYDAPTKAEMDAVAASLALTAYAPLTTTQGNALAASLALTAYDAPTDAEMDTAIASLVAHFALTATSLLSIATPVWAALRADHTTSGSFGQRVASGIPQSIAFSNLGFLMVDETDHRTPKTGLTCGGYVSKNAAAFISVTGTFTEIANGWYQFDASAADMSGETLVFRFTGSGADDTGITIHTSS